MNHSVKALIAASCLALSTFAQATETLTIATVNNSDMIRMQQLANIFEARNPDIKLNWTVLEENDLRQRLTTDIITEGGQFDVMTIGMYEVPLWGARGWLTPMKNLSSNYDVWDVFQSVRDGLSFDGTLYALPFYSESSMTYYRTDLFAQAGLTMPKQPSWKQIAEFAKVLHKPTQEQYGVCLRGKAGWGENMALIGTIANGFGARWFDEQWQPEFTGAEWRDALNFYVNTLNHYGPPEASTNGFNESLALFNSGKCAIWVDATVAGSFVTDTTQSKVADKVGFALAPKQVTDRGAGWLWSWALAIPVSSDAKAAAIKFTTWATSKAYSELVAERFGIANVPAGSRTSTYTNAYMTAAPFARVTLESMKKADPIKPSAKPVPYVGIQFVGIPEFQSVATQVGKQFAAALTGLMTVNQALAAAQQSTLREMKRAGYPK